MEVKDLVGPAGEILIVGENGEPTAGGKKFDDFDPAGSAQAVRSEMWEHVGNEVIHIDATERESWNGKADKAAGCKAGNLAALDPQGNPMDSGLKPGQLMPKIPNPLVGKLPSISADGSLSNTDIDVSSVVSFKPLTWIPGVLGVKKYLAQWGTGFKIGQMVKLRFRIEVNETTSQSAIWLTGLPFPVAKEGGLQGIVIMARCNTLPSTGISINYSSSNEHVILQHQSLTDYNPIPGSVLKPGAVIVGTFDYLAEEQ